MRFDLEGADHEGLFRIPLAIESVGKCKACAGCRVEEHALAGNRFPLWASAVNAGSMHQQKIRVVGEKASIEWWDEHPNQLRYEVQGQPAQLLDRGMDYLYNAVPGIAANRIGGGHAEGFFESWANLYHRFALAMAAADRGDHATFGSLWYPEVGAGIEGVRLLECCVESADNASRWVEF